MHPNNHKKLIDQISATHARKSDFPLIRSTRIATRQSLISSGALFTLIEARNHGIEGIEYAFTDAGEVVEILDSKANTDVVSIRNVSNLAEMLHLGKNLPRTSTIVVRTDCFIKADRLFPVPAGFCLKSNDKNQKRYMPLYSGSKVWIREDDLHESLHLEEGDLLITPSAAGSLLGPIKELRMLDAEFLPTTLFLKDPLSLDVMMAPQARTYGYLSPYIGYGIGYIACNVI